MFKTNQQKETMQKTTYDLEEAIFHTEEDFDLIPHKEKTNQPIKETIKKYKIIKFRKSGTQKVMETNLSLDEAKRYCSRPDTKGKNWFCGFTQQ
jgi:hypothetical protein